MVKNVISSHIKSWNNTQQELGSLKTISSAKIKQLISDINLKIYLVLYPILISINALVLFHVCKKMSYDLILLHPP